MNVHDVIFFINNFETKQHWSTYKSGKPQKSPFLVVGPLREGGVKAGPKRKKKTLFEVRKKIQNGPQLSDQ